MVLLSGVGRSAVSIVPRVAARPMASAIPVVQCRRFATEPPPHPKGGSRWSELFTGLASGMAGMVVGLFVYDSLLYPRLHDADSRFPLWDPDWDIEWRESPNDPPPKDTKFKATRQLLIVRHGQYENIHSDDEESKVLTALGREQAALTGKRLAELMKGKKVTHIHVSPKLRAKETGQIVATQFPGVPISFDTDLEEGYPYYPDPPSATLKLKEETVLFDNERIERAFRRYFWRPRSPSKPETVHQEFDTYEIIVCHGNVTRYFFCRGLQFSPGAWLRLAAFNCAITWMTINNSGFVSARQFADVGHIPVEMLSYW